MRSLAISVTLVLLAGAVAGCIGDDETPTSDDDADLAQEAKATTETGSLTGQVVANDLEVLVGARVALTQDGALAGDATTDQQGRYTFNGLEPGDYRVQATSVCCKTDVKDVEVQAGEVTKQAFQLTRLTKDDLKVPYVTEKDWTGFISCGVSTPVVAAAACSFLSGTPAEDPNEEFLLEFTVDQHIEELVVVMDWDPVGGVSGEQFRLLIENEDCGFNSCSYQYADLRGDPVLRADINEDSITDEEWKWAKIEDNRTLQFRVFATGPATVIYQQPFTVYYSGFYHEAAPDGYDPVPDA